MKQKKSESKKNTGKIVAVVVVLAVIIAAIVVVLSLTSGRKKSSDDTTQPSQVTTKEQETEKKASTMEALAVKDTLTGVWNRFAYDEEVAKLNNDIRVGFAQFGIAMIDLNDLKKINDTYGHENGNFAIKKLCGIICDVFKRSRVFRIGGDEFVVILKKKDFKNIDKRIEEFSSRLMNIEADKSLMPWEKVSAAIGYAVFDAEEDVNVDDVFKRADMAMYQRKSAMKAELNS